MKHKILFILFQWAPISIERYKKTAFSELIKATNKHR